VTRAPPIRLRKRFTSTVTARRPTMYLVFNGVLAAKATSGTILPQHLIPRNTPPICYAGTVTRGDRATSLPAGLGHATVTISSGYSPSASFQGSGRLLHGRSNASGVFSGHESFAADVRRPLEAAGSKDVQPPTPRNCKSDFLRWTTQLIIIRMDYAPDVR